MIEIKVLFYIGSHKTHFNRIKHLFLKLVDIVILFPLINAASD